MRHGRTFNHLSRKSAHRKRMLANMSASLIKHKRIRTTVAKAKALRRYIEPLITKGKDNTTHSRRVVFSYLQDKHAVRDLFGEVAPKVGDRPGGYTRILKLSTPRPGDNADMAIIELVDYNETYILDRKERTGAKKKRTRRAGSGKAKAEAKKEDVAIADDIPEGDVEVPEESVEVPEGEAEVPEEAVEVPEGEVEVPEESAEAVEEPVAETEEQPADEATADEPDAKEKPEKTTEEGDSEEPKG